MTKEQKHMDIVARVGCVICRMIGNGIIEPNVHHIAEGSGKRSDFMTAGLCPDHHTGFLGIHAMGVKRWLMMFDIPTEYHLLGLVNEYRIMDGL